MKKKYSASARDKKDWHSFTKSMENVYDKDASFNRKNIEINKVVKLDLHGLSLTEANISVKRFILKAYVNGCKKLMIVTGKGLRSKVYNDPYRSEKMNVLKYSVPDYIKNDEDLSSKIHQITKASLKDGGEGAFYILLKKKNL